ncbi:MAG: tRNA (adenosine(37)-N6)-threonylcarbamoyltransferase complex dimerization subunit type 1 TsaB [Gammaproteobacteria bacterium]|nr:MAG: tRNA (adenosine(37)-N6)-threonylcarbamoyltransferase complex dimerization subunit type 1 TsaB [Gammaproteobacteria bacterium]|tara:strand:+ start:4283 stop:4990 length:708 start_codon:yes stop_codon:yes gene_type:complete
MIPSNEFLFMNLLALDTSSAACSVCLQIAHQEYSSHLIEPKSHTNTLLPTIQKLLENSGAVINDLDAIILGVGPGSFVGTRIAAAVAQGIAFAGEINLIPISSMEAIAYEAMQKNNLENIIVVQDARMDEIFIGKYQLDNQKNLKTSTPIQLQSKFDKIIDNDLEIAVTGNASNSYLEALNGRFKIRPIKENIIYPNASFLLKLGKKYYSDDLSIKPEELTIDYIRNKVASKATK